MSTNRFITLVSGVQRFVTAISTSAGAGDANKIVATGSNGRLDSSLMPVGVGAATATIPASENLAAGDFVNVWNDSGTRRCRKADASNNRPAHGFVTSAVTSGNNATVFQNGENTGLSGLTPGTLMFLATTAGTATATAPSSVGHIIQPVGYALSTTSILFEFDAPIVID